MPAPYASGDKRAELVLAATRLLHEQGFHRTTLADVAGRRTRFRSATSTTILKTKEALAEAVIVAHELALRGLFAFSWVSAHRDPRERLRRVARAPLASSDSVVQFGCPHGSLCQELEKLGADAPLAKAGGPLLAVYIDWAEEQIRRARLLAATVEGALAADLRRKVHPREHAPRAHDAGPAHSSRNAFAASSDGSTTYPHPHARGADCEPRHSNDESARQHCRQARS